MSGASDLYQSVILDHGKSPRGAELPVPASHRAEGHNPLCGDRATVAARVQDGTIAAIGCRTAGCAISKAAGSLMAQAAQGKSPAEIHGLYRQYLDLVHGRAEAGPELGELAAFAGVAAYPLRIPCATLSWQTLLDALGLPAH